MKYLDSFFYIHEDDRIDFTHKVIRQGLLTQMTDREVKEENIKEYLKTLATADILFIQEGMYFARICKDEELAKVKEDLEKQEANKETTGYYGKYAMWRDRSLEDIQAQLDAGNPWVLRFRSTGSVENQFKFDDLVKGKLTITENDVDHVLLNPTASPPTTSPTQWMIT